MSDMGDRPETQTHAPPHAEMPSPGAATTSRREKVKDFVSIFQSVATAFALLAGAVWFIAQREAMPRATISHSITHRSLTADWTWVYASIRFKNIGKRKIDLHSGIVWLEQILPLEENVKAKLEHGDLILPNHETVEWPTLGEGYKPILDKSHKSLEPGEDQDLEYEFLVPADIHTVKLYSYFERLTEPRIGWSRSTIYEVSPNRKKEAP